MIVFPLSTGFLFQISMQSTLSNGSSLPHIKLKNDVEMSIYQLHNSNEAVGLDDPEVDVQDLVYRKISDLGMFWLGFFHH